MPKQTTQPQPPPTDDPFREPSDNDTDTHALADAIPKTAKKRVWCVIRLRDYGLTGLHPTEDEGPQFERIKSTLYLWTDREAAFQNAREHGGLLCAAESLPRAIAANALESRVRELAANE